MPARSATSANFTEFARDGAFQPVAPIASAAPVIRSNSRRENSLDRLIRKVFTVQKRRTPNHVPYSTRPAARKASSLVFAKIVLQILATTCALCAGCYDSEARDFSSKLHRCLAFAILSKISFRAGVSSSCSAPEPPAPRSSTLRHPRLEHERRLVRLRQRRPPRSFRSAIRKARQIHLVWQ